MPPFPFHYYVGHARLVSNGDSFGIDSCVCMCQLFQATPARMKVVIAHRPDECGVLMRTENKDQTFALRSSLRGGLNEKAVTTNSVSSSSWLVSKE